jgi:hypothetical protein
VRYLIIPTILVLVVLVILAACDEPTKAGITTTPGWSVTSDLTRDSTSFYTYILVDPNGQKFLVVKGNGIAIIPYKEPPVSVKPEKE